MGASNDGRIRIENGQKNIRTQIGGVTIADSTKVKLVWEVPYFPTYYFPQESVQMDLLSDSGETKRSPARGTAGLFDVSVGDKTAAQAARVWNQAKIEEIKDFVSFDWASMDAWFEEDEEVYVHARGPHHRIDILKSSRNIRVEVDGVTVADSNAPRLLFETGLPVRYYLPKSDVRFKYLTETPTETGCPYKGTARYWSVDTKGEVHTDVVWGYDEPLAESERIREYVSFYNEKLDIYVDGVLEERPRTVFS